MAANLYEDPLPESPSTSEMRHRYVAPQFVLSFSKEASALLDVCKPERSHGNTHSKLCVWKVLEITPEYGQLKVPCEVVYTRWL
jgi:hypothetical protein